MLVNILIVFLFILCFIKIYITHLLAKCCAWYNGRSLPTLSVNSAFRFAPQMLFFAASLCIIINTGILVWFLSFSIRTGLDRVLKVKKMQRVIFT